MPLSPKEPVGVASHSPMVPTPDSDNSSGDAKQQDAAKKPNACVRASEAVDGFLQQSFYRLGYFIGNNPWWTILGALIFGLGIAALASQMETEGTRAISNCQLLSSNRLSSFDVCTPEHYNSKCTNTFLAGRGEKLWTPRGRYVR